MIHCGAVIAAGISQGKSTTLKKNCKVIVIIISIKYLLEYLLYILISSFIFFNCNNNNDYM